MFFIIWLEQI